MRKFPALLTFTCLYITVTSLSGCWSFNKDDNTGISPVRDEAYVPIYGIDTGYRKIYMMSPQTIVQAGKIYVLGSNLFQVEKFKGVHIINYGDKANPVKLGFIKVGGVSEIAVKNGYLMANNAEDLVTIDIRDLNNIKEVSRVRGAFKNYTSDRLSNMRPPVQGKYYVCPYPPAGMDVIGWKLEKKVPDATCYYN